MKIKEILEALRANRERDVSLLCLEDEEFLLLQYIKLRAKIKDLETTIKALKENK